MFPGCAERDIKRLQCSHFFARAISSTRFDPYNCIALCYKHHYGDRINGWEYNKHADYRDFMLSWLGDIEYAELCKRAKISVPRATAIIAIQTVLQSK